MIRFATFRAPYSSYNQKTMKKERYIYAAFALLISTLLIFETLYHTTIKTEQVIAADLGEFKQMLIDFDCNVFITKDETENIVLEGPDRMIREIRSENNGEILRLTKGYNGLISLLSTPINSNRSKLNVYIRISDPAKIVISDNMTVISSEYLITSETRFFSSMANISKTLLTTMLPG
jgi:transcriptional regulator of heat shock response